MRCSENEASRRKFRRQEGETTAAAKQTPAPRSTLRAPLDSAVDVRSGNPCSEMHFRACMPSDIIS